MNQKYNFNQNVIPTKRKDILVNKIQQLLKNKKALLIIGAVIISIIALISLIVCIIMLSNKGRSEVLRKEEWTDLVINIDGNNIKLGDSMQSLEQKGFISIDENYSGTLEQKFTSGGLAFVYKDETDSDNTIFFSAHNPETDKKKASECQLNGIELNQLFYNKNNVILPGGLILDNELTIENIIKVWGEATEVDEGRYSWIDNNNEIRIYTNDNDTIFSIVYES